MSEDDNKKPEQEQTKLAELEKQIEQLPKTPKQTPPSSARTSKKQGRPGAATSTAARQAQPARSRSGLLWTFVILNFVLVSAVVGGGYWFWQYEMSQHLESQQTLKQELAVLTSKSSAAETRTSQVEQQNSQLTQQISDLSQQLELANAQAQANNQRLNDVSGRRPADWLLAEADYLVRMAGRKLWLERDVKTAIMMLQSADARLQDMTDPSLLPVRQYLSDDIQTLQQINDVSITSVALALSSLTKQAVQLPLALPKLPEVKDSGVEISHSASDWGENIKKQWQYFVDSLIKYQPRQTPIRPMLDSEQQWLAKEQLRFALMQAQSAAMAENQTLFDQSLQRAIELLVSHFDLEVVAVEQFAESLQNLSNTNLLRDFPQTLSAAQPLKDLLNNRVNAVFTNKGQML